MRSFPESPYFKTPYQMQELITKLIEKKKYDYPQLLKLMQLNYASVLIRENIPIKQIAISTELSLEEIKNIKKKLPKSKKE